MKKIIVMILAAVLLLSGCMEKKPEAPATEPILENEENAGKILVACFSATGNTEPLARIAAEYLNADYYAIEAAQPYTEDDLKYYTGCRADREQDDPDCRPEIAGAVEEMERYDVILLGYPIWHGQAPKILYTFLEHYDLTGKTIVPFCTSASSGLGSSAENLHACAPDAVWREGKRFAIGSDEKTIQSWIDGLNLKK